MEVVGLRLLFEIFFSEAKLGRPSSLLLQGFSGVKSEGAGHKCSMHDSDDQNVLGEEEEEEEEPEAEAEAEAATEEEGGKVYG